MRLPDKETCDRVRAAAEAYGVGGVLAACSLFDKMEAARMAHEAEVAKMGEDGDEEVATWSAANWVTEG